MKILVTGSTGHLGEALIRTLQNGAHQIVGIDRAASPFTSDEGSITDRAFVTQCMKGVEAVFHTATLHKPHIETHTRQDFVDTNVTGTLNLLEAAAAAKVGAFVFTSTTSLFGDALTQEKGAPAVWVTEDLTPIPKNIYGTTKTAAEDLCQLFNRNHGLACIILRTSRFFPEQDDNKLVRDALSDANVKANEFLFRRIDIEDAVDAHLRALKKASAIGFGRYIISATTPFMREDLSALLTNAATVVRQRIPTYEEIYKKRGWEMFPSISRVYVNERARHDLDWQPRYDFQHIIKCLVEGRDYRSPLTALIGSKGYHEQIFSDGPYPVE